jgi:hypothetical protein
VNRAEIPDSLLVHVTPALIGVENGMHVSGSYMPKRNTVGTRGASDRPSPIPSPVPSVSTPRSM